MRYVSLLLAAHTRFKGVGKFTIKTFISYLVHRCTKAQWARIGEELGAVIED